jgi:heptaprenyl diphosphate synthase
VTLADPGLESDVLATLAEVEAMLYASLASADPLVGEAARHLVDAGGKRFRPLLVALAAHLGDHHRPEVVSAAAVVELTHLATLYHDDVMDEARMRRGAPSANARWGNSVAILVGDFLFARAADVAAGLGAEAVRIQARTFSRLVHGQIAETVGPRDADPVEHYLHVLAEKTGSLIATSTRFGAMFSGAPAEQVTAVSRYGELVGIAFQLSDDLIDIASESPESGKTPGTDLREGIPTLPVLRLRERAARLGLAEDIALCELLDSDLSDDTRHAQALAGLRAHPALEQARRDTIRYAEEARAALSPLPEGDSKSALTQLCDAVVHRAG